MKRLVLCITIALITSIPTFATVNNVPSQYSTIQAGINASVNGDTVLVLDGHYYERISYRGKNITVASQHLLDGDIQHIANTIIDADTLVLGVADTGSVVCFVNGEDSTAVLQGFTIQRGTGTEGKGGGIYCSNSSPSIIHNKIIYNSGLNRGEEFVSKVVPQH